MNKISKIIRKKCGDGEKHRIKTTEPLKLFIDNVEVYRAPTKNFFPLKALGIGWALGLLCWPLIAWVIKAFF